ncbi:hypothetical protein ACLOJK_025847 [Asimina triloba]
MVPIPTAKCKEDDDGSSNYTSYKALAGHVWRYASKACDLPNDEQCKLYVVVDGRNRSSPLLPPSFFHNVIFPMTTMAVARELVSTLATFAARRVREMLASGGIPYKGLAFVLSSPTNDGSLTLIRLNKVVGSLGRGNSVVATAATVAAMVVL